MTAKNGFRESELRLYAVTDRRWLAGRTLADAVSEAIDGGATLVQIREKDLDAGAFREEARLLLQVCRTRGVHLLINDNVSLAREIDADGVHVGQKDMRAADVRALLGPEKIIGVTAKTPEQARLAERAGADYLGVGAVFPSQSKTDALHLTTEEIREVCASVSVPAVAIGGITAENADVLLGSGVKGIAVVGALFAADDIAGAARKLRARSDALFGKDFIV